MAPGKSEWNFRYVIFRRILVTDNWGISCEIALIWMSLNFTDGQSALIQVMAWCCQATSHYLSQCWPRSLSPYDVSRPQWVKACVIITFTFFQWNMITHLWSNLSSGIAKPMMQHKGLSVYNTLDLPQSCIKRSIFQIVTCWSNCSLVLNHQHLNF